MGQSFDTNKMCKRDNHFDTEDKPDLPQFYKQSTELENLKGNFRCKHFLSSRHNLNKNPAINSRLYFSTLSKNLAIPGNKNIRNSLFPIENSPVKVRKCNIFELASSQQLEEKNRKEQKEKYECEDEKALEERKKRENFSSLGCCLLSVAPELKWAEDKPWDVCNPCTPPCPKDIPLKRLKRRFKDKDLKVRCPLPEKCKRLDDGKLDIVPKALPKLLPFDPCKPCIVEPPSILPKIPSLKKSYDDSKMKYPHVCIPEIPPCAPRLDDICPIRYRRLRKFETPKGCKPCSIPLPTIIPRLKKLTFEYIDPPRVCQEEHCKWKPDTKKHKKLRKLKFGKCNPCKDFPTLSPKLKRLKKRFKSSKFKWIQICVDPDKCPPRLDEGMMILPKTLKKLQSDCVPCADVITRPKYAPKLKRPLKSYDDQIDKKVVCIDPAACITPRLDAQLSIKRKKLRKYTAGKCLPCIPEGPTICPPLPKLKRAFKDSDVIKECEIPKEPCFRLDGDIRIERTVLPDMPPTMLPCEPCNVPEPTVCPKLVRLRRRAPELERVPCDAVPDTCNINPPRLDDICCVTPRAKILPAFNPKMYPEHKPDDTDYCYREPFDIGNVCCFEVEKKSKSKFLPKKRSKSVDQTCDCVEGMKY